MAADVAEPAAEPLPCADGGAGHAEARDGGARGSRVLQASWAGRFVPPSLPPSPRGPCGARGASHDWPMSRREQLSRIIVLYRLECESMQSQVSALTPAARALGGVAGAQPPAVASAQTQTEAPIVFVEAPWCSEQQKAALQQLVREAAASAVASVTDAWRRPPSTAGGLRHGCMGLGKGHGDRRRRRLDDIDADNPGGHVAVRGPTWASREKNCLSAPRLDISCQHGQCCEGADGEPTWASREKNCPSASRRIISCQHGQCSDVVEAPTWASREKNCPLLSPIIVDDVATELEVTVNSPTLAGAPGLTLISEGPGDRAMAAGCTVAASAEQVVAVGEADTYLTGVKGRGADYEVREPPPICGISLPSARVVPSARVAAAAEHWRVSAD